MAPLPKFQQRVQDQIVTPSQQQTNQPGYGIVMAYDRLTNTATVLMSQPGSDQWGEFYANVPCPTSVGVQGVGPEIGRPCWVIFADGTMSNPMITHYFNHIYEDIDFDRQNKAQDSMPRFMREI